MLCLDLQDQLAWVRSALCISIKISDCIKTHLDSRITAESIATSSYEESAVGKEDPTEPNALVATEIGAIFCVVGS
jgi:hypothetical protein